LQTLEVDFIAAMTTLEKLGRQFQATTKADLVLSNADLVLRSKVEG
jgi:hypothetical protein